NHSGDHTITGWEIGSAHVDECIKAVRDKLDWDNSRHLRGSGRGVGIAVAMHVSGAVVSPASCRAEAAIEISHNGAITLFTGSSDPGTGETTLVVQICAHELGITPEEIAVRVMDTAQTPYDPGAGASKATYVTGNAVRVTAEAVAETLRDEAANILDVNSDEIILKDGYACAGEDKVSFGKAAMSSLEASEQTLRIQREHMAEIPAVALAADQPGYGNLSPSYCFSAQGVELEVDPQTGKINLLKVVAVHDSGVIINPTGARGQVEGGVVMGLGAALGEQLMFQDGRPVITGYGDYAIPQANELPPIDVEFIERKSPRGPYGSKSLAELALMPTAAAVANAVAHATGIRVRSLPITPDKILDKWPNTQDNIELPSILARPSRWWTEIIRKAYPLGLQSLLHNFGTSFARPNDGDSDIEDIHFPSDSNAAVALLTSELDALPIGGGGDVIVARNQGLIVAKNLIDLSACSDMAGVDTNPQGDLHIGATVTLAQLASRLGDSDLSGDRAIAETIRKIASQQIRETATIAGNLGQANRCWFYRGGFECYKRGGFTRPCYAVTGDNRYYHAIIDSGRCQSVTPSDLATTLTALDAIVTIKSVAGQRSIPIGKLYSGPAELELKKGELIFSITIPAPARQRLTYFEKLSLSEGGFAVVSACVSLDRNEVGIISDARVLLGGVANIPYRSNSVERSMIGTALADLDVNRVSKAWVKQAHPLKGNIWKVKAVRGVLRQLLDNLHKDNSKELDSKKI
ncbi:MAG: molybdopterin-dependent oxidoreductase, partial [Candidatus Magasanikbacteria bacterium]|nr:molybdopterin-dependent oxidoreductase [Candidatus Magasanikbacteria bacterium]